MGNKSSSRRGTGAADAHRSRGGGGGGTGASAAAKSRIDVLETYNKEDAERIAAELGYEWDAAAFDALPQVHGRVTGAALLRAGAGAKRTHAAGAATAATESKEAPAGTGGAAYRVTGDVPLTLEGRSMRSSAGTVALLKDIGGGSLEGGQARLRAMCTRFYAHAFEDATLSKFMFETDGAEAHGQRLGDWLFEKMGGGDVWTESRPMDSRQISHHKAWHSKKRPAHQQGRRFKLDDCRVWMRVMFWAAREEGLFEHGPFIRWYVRFIGHFIAVYERSAPPYAQESAEWSADEAKVGKYLEGGKLMTDVIGVGVSPW